MEIDLLTIALYNSSMTEKLTTPPVKMADEVAAQVVAALTPNLEAILARIDSVREELKTDIEASTTKLTEEANVIRKELLELASHQDFRELKGELSEVRNDGRLTRQEVRDAKAEISRLRTDVKVAGIPVR